MAGKGKTLVLGWPVRPKQSWLTQYRDVTADRIYDESVRGGREAAEKSVVSFAKVFAVL